MDPGNWTYLWNAAWVARLSGDASGARELLERAVANDPDADWSILNDLAVLAVRGGDPQSARDYLTRAIRSNPDYDLANWNMGILERAHPTSGLAGEAWLARAIGLNRDLRNETLSFRFDDRVYAIEVRGPTAAEVAIQPGGRAAIAALAFTAVAAAGIGPLHGLAEKAVSLARSGISSVFKARLVGRKPWLRSAGRTRKAIDRLRLSWRPEYVWIPALLLLAVVTIGSAITSAPDAVPVTLVLLSAAVTVAIVTHAAAHRLVSAFMSADVRPARWDAGLVTAVVGLAFGVPAGPYPVDRVRSSAPRAWLVSIAAPAVGLAAAAVAYGMSLALPMPFLRMLAAIHLAVAAYALLPGNHADDEHLRGRPITVATLAFAIGLAAAGLATGAL
jgi:hypothetical protein